MQTFIIKADKSLIVKIKGLIKASDETFLQELTDEQIEALEDIQLAKMGDEAYKEFLAGDRQTYSLDEIIAKHNLE